MKLINKKKKVRHVPATRIASTPSGVFDAKDPLRSEAVERQIAEVEHTFTNRWEW